MTRKVFIISFITAFMYGLLVVFIRLCFNSGYMWINYVLYSLAGVMLFFLTVNVLKSGIVSYSIFRMTVFIFFITVPLIPVVTNEYTKVIDQPEKSAPSNSKEFIQLQNVPAVLKQEKPGTDKSFFGKFSVLFGNIKKLNNFPYDCEKFINKNFILRESVINSYSYYDARCFNRSSNPKVIIGKDKWLFFRPESLQKQMSDPARNGENVIDDFCGNVPFDAKQLEQIKNYLVPTAGMLDSRKIPFIIMIIPNKVSIYDEFLPDYFKVHGAGKRRIDQIIDLCNPIKGIQIIDLRGKMLERKKINRLYLKSDTHWNDRGAYLAYSELIDKLMQYNPGIKKVVSTDFRFKVSLYERETDMAILLNSKDLFGSTELSFLPVKKTLRMELDKSVSIFNSYHGKISYALKITNNDSKKKLLLLHDSFSINFKDYLPYSFGQTWMVWSYKLDEKMIDQIKPDYVVVEIAERFLYLLGL